MDADAPSGPDTGDDDASSLGEHVDAWRRSATGSAWASGGRRARFVARTCELREAGRYGEACRWCAVGLVLFRRWTETFVSLTAEFGFCAFHDGRAAVRRAAARATERVLILPGVPSERRDFCHRNLYWLLSVAADEVAGRPPLGEVAGRPPLGDVAMHKSGDEASEEAKDDPHVHFVELAPASLRTHYRALNPSVQRTKTGFEIVVRTVNFRRTGHEYKSRDPAEPHVVRTRNLVVGATRNLEIARECELVVPSKLEPRYVAGDGVQGLEDCRLAVAGGGAGGHDAPARWFTTTIYGVLPHPTIFVGRFKGGTLCSLRRVTGYREGIVQKNWLPFMIHGVLYAIYGYEPRLVVLRIDGSTGAASVCAERAHPAHDLGRFRGSAGPVSPPWRVRSSRSTSVAEAGKSHAAPLMPGGALLLLHEVIFRDGVRVYTHRFVELDGEWRVTRVSRSFALQRVGVEYACGMALGHEGRGVIVTFGADDCAAWAVRLSWSWVRAQFADSASILG